MNILKRLTKGLGICFLLMQDAYALNTRYILTLDPKGSIDGLNDILFNYTSHNLHKIQVGNLKEYYRLSGGFAINAPSEAERYLQEIPMVKKVHKDTRVSIPEDDDADTGTTEQIKYTLNVKDVGNGYYIQQEAPPQLDSLTQDGYDGRYTYNKNSLGKDINIIVIDTGIADHIDFMQGNKNRIIRSEGFSTYTGITIDDHSHGTHVASIAGGAKYGLAKEANIIPYKCLDSMGKGFISDIVECFEKAYIASKNSPERKFVINASIHTSSAPMLLISIFKKLDELPNVIIVVAAANGAENSCNNAFAKVARGLKSFIVVGALDSETNARASYSNYGIECTHVFAKGTNIPAASSRDFEGTIYKSGTSMSAPGVTGKVATLWSEYRNYSKQQILDTFYLLHTKQNLPILDPKNLGFPIPNKILRSNAISLPAVYNTINYAHSPYNVYNIWPDFLQFESSAVDDLIRLCFGFGSTNNNFNQIKILLASIPGINLQTMKFAAANAPLAVREIQLNEYSLYINNTNQVINFKVPLFYKSKSNKICLDFWRKDDNLRVDLFKNNYKEKATSFNLSSLNIAGISLAANTDAYFNKFELSLVDTENKTYTPTKRPSLATIAPTIYKLPPSLTVNGYRRLQLYDNGNDKICFAFVAYGRGIINFNFHTCENVANIPENEPGVMFTFNKFMSVNKNGNVFQTCTSSEETATTCFSHKHSYVKKKNDNIINKLYFDTKEGLFAFSRKGKRLLEISAMQMKNAECIDMDISTSNPIILKKLKAC